MVMQTSQPRREQPGAVGSGSGHPSDSAQEMTGNAQVKAQEMAGQAQEKA